MHRFKKTIPLSFLILTVCRGVPGFATELAEGPVSMATKDSSLSSIVWIAVAVCLVFITQAGFAILESGFTRAKDTFAIIRRNSMNFSIGMTVFYLFGFSLMFGHNNGFFGASGFMLLNAGAAGSDWIPTSIFQAGFAGIATTIVSGAMAERTKFSGYVICSALICAIIYPVFGSWAWPSLVNGSGWLESLGFTDFAGSTVVHSIGGWLALAGAITLGPRIGKYSADGKTRAIPGRNIALASLGVFIVWLGLFGFHVAAASIYRDSDIGRIILTTTLASVGGAFAALLTSWFYCYKSYGATVLNGALAGLVAISAGSASVSASGSLIIGLGAGMLVVWSLRFINRTHLVDDPVAAVSVHGICGAFGTLAVGLLAADAGALYGGGLRSLGIQTIGVAAGFVWAFGSGMLLFHIIKASALLRLTVEEELHGLDVREPGKIMFNFLDYANNKQNEITTCTEKEDLDEVDYRLHSA